MTASLDPGVRPGGGRNPRPFAPGGGFSGMVGAQFRRYWIARPEIAPLLGALGIGVMLMAWGLVHVRATERTSSLARVLAPAVPLSAHSLIIHSLPFWTLCVLSRNLEPTRVTPSSRANANPTNEVWRPTRRRPINSTPGRSCRTSPRVSAGSAGSATSNRSRT
ncbi:hypothetical protein T492DRAFT_924704 [Pavlovales sp. CCMP2436]|nr:hypothetical protein T492DRAFT_924704 [Pavlovales sp. CCMP2436]